MGVGRARLQVLGVEFRLAAVVAVHARAALAVGGQVDAGRDHGAARPLGAVEALVAGEAHHVEAFRLHVDGHQAGRLRGVDHKQRPVGVRDARERRHVVDVAGEVARVRDDRHLGSGREGSLESSQIEARVGRDRHDGHRDPLPVLFAEEGAQHRVVRGGRRHRRIARTQKPVDHRIQGVGHVEPENHALGVGRVEEAGDLLARAVDRHPRIERGLMGAPPRAPERVDGSRHGARHLGRLVHRSSRVVEIDSHVSPTDERRRRLPAASGRSRTCW